MIAFRTYLLDVDGTLVDSNDIHAAAWSEVLTAHGHAIEPARVRPYIGMGGDRLIEELTGIARGSAQNKAIGEERGRLFLDTYVSRVRPIPGARELLLALRERGHAYAIASAAKDEELEPLLGIAGIKDLVTVRTSSSDVDESKPDPEIIEAALTKLGAPTDGAVMVGDTPYDVQAARRAGIACIGVTTGGWTTRELAGCTAVFSSIAELTRKL
ncbi:MAG: HAD family hydrolase [Kofleriaceae bacterium]